MSDTHRVKVSARGATKVFPAGGAAAGGYTALKDFDLEVRDGEFLVLVGPSGCGKSTALKPARRPRPADRGHPAAGRTAHHRPGPRPQDRLPAVRPRRSPAR
ncbi:ATP-binding cassette domain-containing protein [Actinoplanes subtropicus]|uniref:ATP-binding cassette domain-containing protein n=1 Tax=Actinoplanes subtropicus TaxID=543632 RepID=UPI0009FF64AC